MVDLTEFAGRFEEGWTEEDIESVLPQIEDRLGLHLVSVWEYEDDFGMGGSSDLAVVGGGGLLLTIPDGLWDLLVHGEVASIDPTSGQGVHLDFVEQDYAACNQFGHNVVLGVHP